MEEVAGVVIEAVFPDGLPEIYNALEIDIAGETDGETRKLICEVQQHLGDDRVRAVAMDATDGIARGTEVRDTGGPITVPVGQATLGRIFNLLGEPIDEGDPVVRPRSAGRSTARPPTSRTSRRRARCSRPASRSSTCSRPTRAAARSACSAAPAWARPSSSRS